MSIFQETHRDPDRITPMLAKVEELWKKSPHLRLGQLLGNCAKSEVVLYYMEDDVLLEKMKAMYKDVDKDV
jgi:hypothetical protein